MRRYLLSAAAALAIATPAGAETSGYVDAGYESGEFDFSSGFTEEYEALHLGGAVHHPFGNGWGIQADGRTVLQSFDGTFGDDGQAYAAVHAYAALSDHWDIGGYVGLSDTYGFGGSNAGIEARTSFGNLSLQGSASYDNLEDVYTAWDYRVAGSWFFTPNFAATAGVGATDWDYDVGLDAESTDWSAGATYQFAGGLAVYGSYNMSDSDWVTFTYEVEAFRIGVRWNFNGGDLQSVTNEGASWNAAAALHEQRLRHDL